MRDPNSIARSIAFFKGAECYRMAAVLYYALRAAGKPVLQPHQRGRTHKRKQRGTRKVKNMGWRQYMRHMFDIGEW